MPLEYQINNFKELVEKYPSWEDLRKTLESDEGGSFRVVDTDTENGFCLIRYEKNTSNMNLPYSKWFRSVVWNTKTNRPVCLAPPKATSSLFPFKTLKELSNAAVLCQELLDGFMINCFKVVGDSTVYITSRSKLNAAGKFYSEKSFRDLFMEAYVNTNPGQSICHIPDLDESKGEVAVFYSYLVQHVEHRIVAPISENRVFVVHRGIVFADGRVQIEDSPITSQEKQNIESIVVKPTQGSYAQAVATVDGVSEIDKFIKNYLAEKLWSFQGLVFKDASGNRWRFRSEKYGAIKSLRGNSNNIRERFAHLYSQNLLHKYMEYYPEEMMTMTFNLLLVNTIIKTLYDNYVDLHITKTKTADKIEKAYLPHLYNIHGIYLSQLKPNGKKININEIQIYLHKQPWQRIAFLIKKQIEKINDEAVQT